MRCHAELVHDWVGRESRRSWSWSWSWICQTRRDERAKQVCATCPVLQQCREHALAAREPYGVWGGMTEDERATYHEAVDKGQDPTLEDPAHQPAS